MEFNLLRFKNILKYDFTIYKKPLILGVIGITILLFLFIIFNGVLDDGWSHNKGDYLNGWMQVLLLPIGLFLTSIIFWEFKNASGRLQYLAIPVSHLEKFLSRWMYTLILFPFLFIGLVYSMKYFLGLIWPGFGEQLTWAYTFEIYKFYIIAHSIILMFAIWFNKYTAPKAAIVAFVLMLITTLISALFFRMVFANLFESCFEMSRNYNVQPKPEFQKVMENKFGPIAKNLLYIFVPLFFWVVGFFKLTEKEA